MVAKTQDTQLGVHPAHPDPDHLDKLLVLSITCR